MADLSITAANVTPGTGMGQIELTAGATITAGQACYMDTAASNVAKLAQSDGTSAEAEVKGVALNSASTGQPIKLGTSGTMDLGATLTVGTIYCLSDTAGGIVPSTDLSTGEYVSIIGIATAADTIALSIKNSGVEVPA